MTFQLPSKIIRHQESDPPTTNQFFNSPKKWQHDRYESNMKTYFSQETSDFSWSKCWVADGFLKKKPSRFGHPTPLMLQNLWLQAGVGGGRWRCLVFGGVGGHWIWVKSECDSPSNPVVIACAGCEVRSLYDFIRNFRISKKTLPIPTRYTTNTEMTTGYSSIWDSWHDGSVSIPTHLDIPRCVRHRRPLILDEIQTWSELFVQEVLEIGMKLYFFHNTLKIIVKTNISSRVNLINVCYWQQRLMLTKVPWGFVDFI